jgi:diguanylate cyclase (GGDEF)-like protein/putative nucleotidyltransferase with HDIG domain
MHSNSGMRRLSKGMKLPFLATRTRGRLTLALMAMAVLPVILIGVLSFSSARSSLQQRVFNNLDGVLDLKQSEISRWLNLVGSDTQLLGDNYLNEEHITVILDDTEFLSNRHTFSHFLTENLLSLQESREGYEEIFYVDRDGVIILSTNADRVGQNVADTEIVRQIFASPNGTATTDMFHFEDWTEMDFAHVLRAIDPVIMAPTDKIIAAVVIRVRLEDSLFPIVRDWPARGETGETLLIRQVSGKWLYASPLRFDDSRPLTIPVQGNVSIQTQMPSGAQAQIGSGRDYRGVPVFSGYRSVPGSNWVVGIEQDVAEAFGPVYQLRLILGLVGVTVLVAAYIVARVLANNFSVPLNQLTQATRQVESGDLNVRLAEDRDDEFGSLAKAFNKMIESVKANAENIEQHARELQAIVNVSNAFLSSADVHETMEMALREAITATRADVGVVSLMVENNQEFETVASIGMPSELIGLKYPLDAHSTPGFAMMQHKGVISADLSEETRFSVPPIVRKMGVAADLAAPMQIDGRTVGAITVGSLKAMHFSQKDLDIVQAIANHSAVALERIKLVSDLSESYDRTLAALAIALDTRDRETEGHSKRVVAYTLALAERIGVPSEQMQDISRGALLHDIGKIGVPDAILHKTSGLTDAEWAVIRKHPEWGQQILAGIHFLDEPAKMVLAHHERWDGSGYPLGVRAENIPLGARIFAVVDAFDAMTSHRPYRSAESYQKARAEIRSGRGSQFDPKIVDVFLEFTKEDWAGLREEAEKGENGLSQSNDMGSLRRISSGQLQSMNIIISAITSSLESNEVLQRTVQVLNDVTRVKAAGIYLYAPEEQKFNYIVGANLHPALSDTAEPLSEEFLPPLEALLQNKTEFYEEIALSEEAPAKALHRLNPQWGSALYLPLHEGDRMNALLLLFSESPVTFTADEQTMFEHVGEQLSHALINARMHEKVRTQAITDGLTGAYNRRYLDDFLNIEVKRCQRYKRPMAILMLDMDHFRECNENGGHQAGDKALRDVVQLLNMAVRSVDLVSRYGGEEFLVVLPETDEQGAWEAAERIRRLVEKHRFPCGKLTASVGVAASTFQEGDSPNMEELIEHADRALYKAKQDGRNRVQIWDATVK